MYFFANFRWMNLFKANRVWANKWLSLATDYEVAYMLKRHDSSQ